MRIACVQEAALDNRQPITTPITWRYCGSIRLFYAFFPCIKTQHARNTNLASLIVSSFECAESQLIMPLVMCAQMPNNQFTRRNVKKISSIVVLKNHLTKPIIDSRFFDLVCLHKLGKRECLIMIVRIDLGFAWHLFSSTFHQQLFFCSPYFCLLFFRCIATSPFSIWTVYSAGLFISPACFL